MSETAQKLLEQIRALPEAEREWIAHELWDEREVAADELDELQADPQFQAMLAERLEQVEKHPERLIGHADAMKMIREHLAAQRGEPTP